MRQVRICYFNQWAGGLEPTASYLARVPAIDLRPLVANPQDAVVQKGSNPNVRV